MTRSALIKLGSLWLNSLRPLKNWMLQMRHILVLRSPLTVENSQERHAQKKVAIQRRATAVCCFVVAMLYCCLKKDGVSAFCCFVAGSDREYPLNWSLIHSSSVVKLPWRGSLRRFDRKTSATLSTASRHVLEAKWFLPLFENSRSLTDWQKAPRIRGRSSGSSSSRKGSWSSSILCRKESHRDHQRSSLAFVADVRADSRACLAAESLSRR